MHWAAIAVTRYSATTETGAALAGKMGEEARMLPVGHPRQDDPLEIGKDRFHAFAVLWRSGGNLRGDLAGCCLRAHGAVAQRGPVGGAPLRCLSRPFRKRRLVHLYLLRIIFAPGRAAPDEMVSLPPLIPVELWAEAQSATITQPVSTGGLGRSLTIPGDRPREAT
jgi:hypothetical protein